MNRLYILLIAIFAFCACQPNGEHHGKREKAPVKVETMTVSSASSISRHSYMGEVVPAKSVTLLSPYPGTVQEIKASKGTVVGKGTVTAVIRSQSVESAYQIAQANLQQAQDGYERVNKVYSTGSVTEARMVEIQTLLAKAEASMESAAKAVEDCSLKAPYRGVVSEVFPTAGVDVLAGERIMTIIDLSELKIRISVHENEINSIRNGATALVDIPALGLAEVKARVTEKNLLSSKLTHSYACTLVLEKRVERLMPGMLAKVRFESTGDDSLVVPADAVQLDADGKYVWLYESGFVAKRRITAGGYSGMGVVVTEGLEEGEKVIVKGYQKVSGGMKVIE
ncbi:MAG: efflux RND transporter periplasmic adaptor subunit [Bacteroidales bacterium]|nr:efflux RND transporter periplasmic adaptor subunit [Candidatus Cacconaster equi]